jgi:NurA-like 5'-3' nuclease
MLDTLACVQLIKRHAVAQQSLYAVQLQAAKILWQRLLSDQTLQERVQQKMRNVFMLPLDTLFRATQEIHRYSVCGIDGSQIYPDRHEGFSEYLINIGTAHFTYSESSHAQLQNSPYLFSGVHQGGMVTPELVNSQRTEYELMRAAEVAVQSSETCIMVDGALMFWHLQTPTMQELFLQKYLASLALIQKAQAVYMGYISASHSREIIALLQTASEILGDPQTFDYLVDTDIMNFFLKPGQYTQVFKTNSLISALYPESLEPCFLYLNVGDEIARIELPAYCAFDTILRERCIQIVLDQNKKGNGYPVALSEAHEQAVVKAADREFFYTLLRMQNQQTSTLSLKLSKKRSAAV